MSGMGAFILIHIGAFIRWSFTGFRGSFKGFAEGAPDAVMKNDIKNIMVALVLFFAFMFLIQFFFF